MILGLVVQFQGLRTQTLRTGNKWLAAINLRVFVQFQHGKGKLDVKERPLLLLGPAAGFAPGIPKNFGVGVEGAEGAGGKPIGFCDGVRSIFP
jgi:hypothetical protein